MNKDNNNGIINNFNQFIDNNQFINQNIPIFNNYLYQQNPLNNNFNFQYQNEIINNNIPNYISPNYIQPNYINTNNSLKEIKKIEKQNLKDDKHFIKLQSRGRENIIRNYLNNYSKDYNEENFDYYMTKVREFKKFNLKNKGTYYYKKINNNKYYISNPFNTNSLTKENLKNLLIINRFDKNNRINNWLKTIK